MKYGDVAESCWHEPWALDSPEKVDWANRTRDDQTTPPFRLGDRCFFRPVGASNSAPSLAPPDQPHIEGT
jgi:hypothetical protein